MKLFLLFAFITLVLSQGTTTTCPNSCWAPNTNPCPKSNTQKCEPNPLATSSSGGTNALCKFVCIEGTATSDERQSAFQTCGTSASLYEKCDQQSYQCDANTQDCVATSGVNGASCYTCKNRCQTSCLVDPCADTTSKQYECAKKVAGTTAQCKANYCDPSPCTAEYYNANGERICDRIPDACPQCSSPCATGQVRKVDPHTGCDVCDSCQSTCPVCSNNGGTSAACPYGFKMDSNNCPAQPCQCNPCPVFQCTLDCANGYKVNPTTNCKECACNPPSCPPLDSTTCTLDCANAGFVIGTDGCKKCECNKCPDVACDSTVPCKFYEYVNGCKTCKCLPNCTNYCPNGYDISTASSGSNGGTTSTTTYCKCTCPALTNCATSCPLGNVVDAYGCKKCECIKDYNTCDKVACDTSCLYGYQTDSSKPNCPTCKCNEKPICPQVLCFAPCPYGTIPDPTTGCPTCNCVPCPKVLCTRYCANGYAVGADGCPVCDCNKDPVCTAASNIASTSCPLDCVTGLSTTDGCKECKCNEVKPCVCDPVPTNFVAKVCPDGVSKTYYTGDCKRSSDNKCTLVFVDCPIGIKVTTTGTLTEQQIADIKAKNGITNDQDVTVTKTTENGKNTYTIWIKKEGLAEGKTADDVNSDVSGKAKENDPNAVSFVIGEQSTTGTGFGSIIVPLFGLLAFVFF